MQAKSGKVQSFSKFQAELRAQHKHSKSKHKQKRDKRHDSDKHGDPKAPSQTNHADHANDTQVSCTCVLILQGICAIMPIAVIALQQLIISSRPETH